MGSFTSANCYTAHHLVSTYFIIFESTRKYPALPQLRKATARPLAITKLATTILTVFQLPAMLRSHNSSIINRQRFFTLYKLVFIWQGYHLLVSDDAGCSQICYRNYEGVSNLLPPNCFHTASRRYAILLGIAFLLVGLQLRIRNVKLNWDNILIRRIKNSNIRKSKSLFSCLSYEGNICGFQKFRTKSCLSQGMGDKPWL